MQLICCMKAGLIYPYLSLCELLQHLVELELIQHIPRVPRCIASATGGFNPGEIRLIEHAQDSLVQACAVVSMGVSDIHLASMGNKRALFVMLVDQIPQFEAY
jgi:hypothetical protein